MYFLANGVLAHGAIPGNCVGGATDTCNLYVWHDGATRLVAVLSSQDQFDWSGASTATARVSPDGKWLAFMSQRELTGYDTRDAASNVPDQEVYLYDADGTGHLVCASCNPTGARPAGIDVNGNTLVDVEHGEWENRWLAGNIPPWTSYVLLQALYQSRYLSDGGRLFFNSNDALVPQDVNGREDVYEYEPPGIGGCTVTSAGFSRTLGWLCGFDLQWHLR